MRFGAHPRFDRDLSDAPADVYAWALDWVRAAKSLDATWPEIIAGATPLKGGDFRNCYVRKWRRKKPRGEYRLVFFATKEEVIFFSLEPRGADYKIAARRIRAMTG